ncbi:MAG: hypothetical protein DSZ28_09695 [Thiothrix sp.]|nr:MAG: hypothetical protein DSZ28_09695 [Thiothrix sp.]
MLFDSPNLSSLHNEPDLFLDLVKGDQLVDIPGTQGGVVKGENELILTPNEFLDRIAALIPTPRRHRHRHRHRHRNFSILAPKASWHKAIIARAGLPVETRIPKQELETPGETEDQDRSDTTIPRLTKSHHGYALWYKHGNHRLY